jgi:hypothetical protein
VRRGDGGLVVVVVVRDDAVIYLVAATVDPEDRQGLPRVVRQDEVGGRASVGALDVCV